MVKQSKYRRGNYRRTYSKMGLESNGTRVDKLFMSAQGRIYRNDKSIHWVNLKVHEVVEGAKKVPTFHHKEEFCLYLMKDIKRQERQNRLYENISNR